MNRELAHIGVSGVWFLVFKPASPPPCKSGEALLYWNSFGIWTGGVGPRVGGVPGKCALLLGKAMAADHVTRQDVLRLRIPYKGCVFAPLPAIVTRLHHHGLHN